MQFKNLLLAAFLTCSVSAFAATESVPQAEVALAGVDWRNVEKMLAKHFSLNDIESLKRYVTSAMMGLPTPMGPELKAKVRNFMMDMRLEYGFQFAVLMAELKKKAFRFLPPELAELADELTQKPKADLEE